MGLPPHVLSPPPANLEEGVQRANGYVQVAFCWLNKKGEGE